ncbi:hypothetical protein FKM82_030287 [Ascaphus truei]
MELANITIVKEFVLKGISGGPMFQIMMFVMLLIIFIITVAGNSLIIGIISADYRLHTPMYFFLVNLSVLETSSILLVVPKVLIIAVAQRTSISMVGCFIQCFFYFLFTSTAFLLLAVMSFDRYMAISHPLRYPTIMSIRVCAHLVVGCWLTSTICLLYPIIMISKKPFCGQILDHFFCDGAAIQKLICADITLIKLSSLISASIVLIGSLIVTMISYIFIVITVLRIPTGKGRYKTFSTCASHLMMVSLVFGSAIFIEIKPSKGSSVENDKIVNFVSTILSPLLNPFIYTLRNQKVKEAIRDAMIRKKMISQ